MECQTCTLLEDSINESAKKPDQKKKFEADLEYHWADQELYRDHYSDTIVKAEQNSDWDLVIHVDGGKAGSEYLPYFFQDITGEPAGHSTVKVKNTFVQIHNWGSVVFQSYPVLEEMSSNHVIEVCLFCLKNTIDGLHLYLYLY